MHFEVLVEDQSGKKALDILIPEITGGQGTYRIISYRGIGRIPKHLKSKSEANKRILLDQISRLLKGYGKTFADYPSNYPAAVILVCDLDDKCLKTFRQKLFTVLNACDPKPETRFCIAIEEGEAWLLGDMPAIKQPIRKPKTTYSIPTKMTPFVEPGNCWPMLYSPEDPRNLEKEGGKP